MRSAWTSRRRNFAQLIGGEVLEVVEGARHLVASEVLAGEVQADLIALLEKNKAKN